MAEITRQDVIEIVTDVAGESMRELIQYLSVRFDAIDQRFDNIENRSSNLELDVKGLKFNMIEVKLQLADRAALENRVGHLERKVFPT